LNSAGLKGTFFVTSEQIADNGFTGYMSKSQIINLANQGHEIGSHTRTHTKLTSLSYAGQQDEIEGSRDDLLSWGVGPVNSFAYPFGDYNATTISIVKNAGYDSAASTINGYVSPVSDRYQLERQSVESGTTITQIKQWIDSAAANKRWLILTFHGIDNTGERYSTTPAIFNQAVDYLVQKGLPVVTVSEGLQSLE
jgi:peptidoglycan/xylan/chitin deacetylase (PgdA/CDA1 family)